MSTEGAERPTGLEVLLSTFPSKRVVREAMRHAVSMIIETSASDDALSGRLDAGLRTPQPLGVRLRALEHAEVG